MELPPAKNTVPWNMQIDFLWFGGFLILVIRDVLHGVRADRHKANVASDNRELEVREEV